MVQKLATLILGLAVSTGYSLEYMGDHQNRERYQHELEKISNTLSSSEQSNYDVWKNEHGYTVCKHIPKTDTDTNKKYTIIVAEKIEHAYRNMLDLEQKIDETRHRELPITGERK